MTVDAGQEVANLSGDTYPSVSQFLQAAATGGININIHVSNDVIKEPPARGSREDSHVGKSGAGKRSFLIGKRPGGEQNAGWEHYKVFALTFYCIRDLRDRLEACFRLGLWRFSKTTDIISTLCCPCVQ